MAEKTISQQLVEKATKEGKIPPPWLRLCFRQEKKVDGEVVMKNDKPVMIVVGTGPHKVKLISERYVKGRDYITKQERDEVEYTFEENGQKKKYNVPVKDKNDELHYLVQRMAEVAHGEVITLEYKKDGMTGFIDTKRDDQESSVSRQIGTSIPKVPEEEIPIIEEGNENINPEDIPF